MQNKNLTGNRKELAKFLEPTGKPKVIYTDKSLEFGKACEDLSWNHCTSTPHRSQTNGVAERAVRRVKEGTSAVLLQSGLNELLRGSLIAYLIYEFTGRRAVTKGKGAGTSNPHVKNCNLRQHDRLLHRELLSFLCALFSSSPSRFPPSSRRDSTSCTTIRGTETANDVLRGADKHAALKSDILSASEAVALFLAPWSAVLLHPVVCRSCQGRGAAASGGSSIASSHVRPPDLTINTAREKQQHTWLSLLLFRLLVHFGCGGL